MKLVFFGSNNTARQCLSMLYKQLSGNEIYVVTKKNYETPKSNVYGLAKKLNLKILKFSTIENTDTVFDYAFTIRYHKILTPTIIKKFKNGVINFHGGLLPYYRGSCNHIFSMLNGEKTFGVSFHFIDEGIDTGPIIDKIEIPICENDTGFDLLQRGNKNGLILFNKIITYLKTKTTIPSKPQDLNLGHTYQLKDLEKYREIKLNDINEKDLLKRLKAFYHPERDSIFTYINNLKVSLKLDR